MIKIGYLSLSTISEKNYIGALEQIGASVQLLDLEQIGLKEISMFDVLIIQDDENRFIEYVCEALVYLKHHSSTLIWFISSKLPKINRTIYPRLGVDGLADQNSEPEEVALLVSNGLKRIINEPKNSHLSKKVVLTPNNLSLNVAGIHIYLTRLEFSLMNLLLENRDNIVTYEEIYKDTWRNDVANQQYKVSNLVFHLRKKIIGSGVDIKTIRSVGYRLEVN